MSTDEEFSRHQQIAAVFEWLRHPADSVELETAAEYRAAINGYFEDCLNANEEPRATGLALALGLPGISSIWRLGRRRDDLRWMLSRAVTAVSCFYERKLDGRAAKGAIFALQQLDDFDTVEPAGSPQLPAWRDKTQIDVKGTLVGVIDVSMRGVQLSPEEAYFRMMNQEGMITVGSVIEEKVINPEPVKPEPVKKAKQLALPKKGNQSTFFKQTASKVWDSLEITELA